LAPAAGDVLTRFWQRDRHCALSAGVTSWNEVVDGGPFAAVVVAAPNFLGCLEDIGAARAIADHFGAA